LFSLLAATHSDINGLENTKQDTWIATADEKLASYIEYSGYLSAGKNTGLFSIINRYAEQGIDEYWNSVDRISKKISKDRTEYLFRDNIDVDEYLVAIRGLHSYIDSKYCNVRDSA